MFLAQGSLWIHEYSEILCTRVFVCPFFLQEVRVPHFHQILEGGCRPRKVMNRGLVEILLKNGA